MPRRTGHILAKWIKWVWSGPFLTQFYLTYPYYSNCFRISPQHLYQFNGTNTLLSYLSCITLLFNFFLLHLHYWLVTLLINVIYLFWFLLILWGGVFYRIFKSTPTVQFRKVNNLFLLIIYLFYLFTYLFIYYYYIHYYYFYYYLYHFFLFLIIIKFIVNNYLIVLLITIYYYCYYY